MVVRFNKIILFVSLFFITVFSPVTFAEELYKYKAQILSEVQKKFTIALMELEIATGECDAEKERSHLNASHLKGINLTGKEMMTALFYFSAKADLECITEAKYKNLAYSSLIYQSTLKSYNENLEFSPYIFFNSGTDESLKIRYNEIAPEHRDALERIPELSKPFDGYKMFKQIESGGITPE